MLRNTIYKRICDLDLFTKAIVCQKIHIGESQQQSDFIASL